MDMNSAHLMNELGAEVLGTSVNPAASQSAKMPQAERQQLVERVQETEPLRPRESTAIGADSHAERARLQAAVSAYLRRQESLLELMERNLRPLLSETVVAALAEQAPRQESGRLPASGEQRFDRERQTSLISTGELAVNPAETSADNTVYSVLEQSLSTNRDVVRRRQGGQEDAFAAQMAIAPAPIAAQDPALVGDKPAVAADLAGEPASRTVESKTSPAQMPSVPEQALRQAIEESLAALRSRLVVGPVERVLAPVLLDPGGAGRAEIILRALEEKQMAATLNSRGRLAAGPVQPMLLDTAR